jgi:hypothetical protein
MLTKPATETAEQIIERHTKYLATNITSAIEKQKVYSLLADATFDICKTWCPAKRKRSRWNRHVSFYTGWDFDMDFFLSAHDSITLFIEVLEMLETIPGFNITRTEDRPYSKERVFEAKYLDKTVHVIVHIENSQSCRFVEESTEVTTTHTTRKLVCS